MNDIEREVRKEVANNMARMVRAHYVNDPAAISQMKIDTENILNESVEVSTLFERTMMQGIIDEFTAEKLSQSVADSWMVDGKYTASKLEDAISQFEGEASAEVKSLCDSTLRFVEGQDSIVRRVMESYAGEVTYEHIFEAIRAEFPTREGFEEWHDSLYVSVLSNTSALFGEGIDDVLATILGKVVGIYFKDVSRIQSEAVYGK